VLKRYSFENYYYDPLNVFYFLKNSEKEIFKNFCTDYSIDENDLQNIVNVFADILWNLKVEIYEESLIRDVLNKIEIDSMDIDTIVSEFVEKLKNAKIHVNWSYWKSKFHKNVDVNPKDFKDFIIDQIINDQKSKKLFLEKKNFNGEKNVTIQSDIVSLEGSKNHQLNYPEVLFKYQGHSLLAFYKSFFGLDSEEDSKKFENMEISFIQQDLIEILKNIAPVKEF
jgi:hypothetical protein